MTAKVQTYLTANDKPFSSFSVDGPSDFPIAPDAEDIHAARSAIIDAAQEVRDPMLGPREYIQSYAVSAAECYERDSYSITPQHNELLSMQVITRFGITTSFPIHEEA